MQLEAQIEAPQVGGQRLELRRQVQPLGQRGRVADRPHSGIQRMGQSDAITGPPRNLQRLSGERVPPIPLGPGGDELDGKLAEQSRAEHTVARSERCGRFRV